VGYLGESSQNVEAACEQILEHSKREPTLEELRKQKRQLHLSTFQCALKEVQCELAQIAHEGKAEERLARDRTRMWRGKVHTTSDFLNKILEDCAKVLQRHKQKLNEESIDDSGVDEVRVHRALVEEMLETRAAAVHSLRRYLEDENCRIESVLREPLQDGHRFPPCLRCFGTALVTSRPVHKSIAP
jgi:hypothetical protein